MIDYAARLAKRETDFFDNPKIADDIKTNVRRFLLTYHVSDARKTMFFEKFSLIAQSIDTMQDLEYRDTVNKLFFDLHRRFSKATYHTYVSIAIRFMRWVHEGERPRSFCDIKAPGAKYLTRNLKPSDMITWEEGVQLSNWTYSIQFKAQILTQLDGGFRPSEFEALKFGNIRVEEDAIIAFVDGGKTGRRVVVLRRCREYLLHWLDVHPSKNPEDPLWVLENPTLSRKAYSEDVIPNDYVSIRNRLNRLAKKHGFKKPVDFYNLRHSSCVLDKLDNLPVDLAAERHGHSVKHFTETYGRLSPGDVVKRYLKHYETSAGTAGSTISNCNR